MPEFVLKAGRDVMPPEDARDYAATWAAGQSYGIESRFYNFESDFRVYSESDRAECLEYMETNRALVVANPSDFEPDELRKLDSFVRALKAAPAVGDATARPPAGADRFHTLDEFTRAYIEAMFWTDNEPGEDSDEWREREARGEGPSEGNFPNDVGPNDLADSAFDSIVGDCAAFQNAASAHLAQAYQRDGYSAAQAGHDFWLTRNGHGSGFWDRSVLKAESLGASLTDFARLEGGVDSYFGDDSKVYHG